MSLIALVLAIDRTADYVEPPSVMICGVVLGGVHTHYVWRNTAWTKCPRGSWVILTHLFLSFGVGQFDPYHFLSRFVPSWHEVKNKKAVTRRHDKTEVAATPNFSYSLCNGFRQRCFPFDNIQLLIV